MTNTSMEPLRDNMYGMYPADLAAFGGGLGMEDYVELTTDALHRPLGSAVAANVMQAAEDSDS